MNISSLIILIRESKCLVRLKPKNYSEPREWSWVGEPVPGYIESGSGPWPFKDIEWLEIDPIITEHIGKLMPPRKMNKILVLENALQKAAISYTLVDGILRVNF